MITNPLYRQLLLGLFFSFGVFIPPYGDRFVSASPNIWMVFMMAMVLYVHLREHPEAATVRPWKLALQTSWIPACMVGVAMVIAGLMRFEIPSWFLGVAGFGIGFGLIMLVGQLAALLVEVKHWINRRADA